MTNWISITYLCERVKKLLYYQIDLFLLKYKLTIDLSLLKYKRTLKPYPSGGHGYAKGNRFHVILFVFH